MASLTDVADRAGYTIGAVYSNFSSKDGLFLAVMRDRLPRIEAMLAGAFAADGQSASGPAASVDERITQELDRLAAGEDSVPLDLVAAPVGVSDPCRGRSEDVGRACRVRAPMPRDHRPSHRAIRGDIGIVLPVSAIELAELTSALSDGLRAAHAEGRSALTSGQGLRLVVAALIETSPRVGRPDRHSRSGRRHQPIDATGRSGGETASEPGAPRRRAGAPGAESDRCRARRHSSFGQVRLQPGCLVGAGILPDDRRDRQAGLPILAAPWLSQACSSVGVRAKRSCQ